MSARILVAGIGNIFLGDDAFGVEVARRLDGTLPSEVTVMEVGVRSLHLAHVLLERPDLLLVVDAVRGGDTPGTLTLIEPVELATAAAEPPPVQGVSLATVMVALRSLGGTPPPTLLVGCEPSSTTVGIGLSPVVEHAVSRAEEMVRAVIERHLVRTVLDAGRADCGDG
jgi:hydrogenase maturation protease